MNLRAEMCNFATSFIIRLVAGDVEKIYCLTKLFFSELFTKVIYPLGYFFSKNTVAFELKSIMRLLGVLYKEYFCILV